MKKFILLILILFSFSTITIYAEETIPNDEVVEEVEPIEEIGFFEGVIVGFFDFVTSEEFTKLATSIGALLLALYPFIRKYLGAKGEAKYNKLITDVTNWKQKADEYEKLAIEYAKIADNAIVQVAAIKDSLEIGFDKSNLREDVKDKIMQRLNSVPKIEVPVVEEEPKEEVKPIVDEEKDNTLTEPIKNTYLDW